MGKLAKFYLLELKNSCFCMLRFILVIILAVGILFGSIYVVANVKAGESEDNRIVIGVVSKDTEDTLFPQLISFANNITSLKGFCRLEMFSEKEAMDKLRKNEIGMIMSIPEGFMSAAQHMEEAEFTVYLPKNDYGISMAQNTIISLFHSVEQIMMNTEGAIWSMYEGMDRYTFSMTVSEMEDDIFNLYIANFMGRDAFFSSEYLSKYGRYTVAEYYFVSVVFIMMYLFATVFFRLYGSNELRLEIILSNSRTKKWITAVMKIVSSFIPMFVIEFVIIFLGSRLGEKYGFLDIKFDGGMVMYIILTTVTISIIMHLCAAVFGLSRERVIIYLLLVILMALLSGSVGSVYYLPEKLKAFSDYWPVSMMRNLMLAQGKGLKVDAFSKLRILVMDIIMLITGCLLYVRRLNRHE